MSLARNVSMAYLKQNGMYQIDTRYYSAKITSLELTSFLTGHVCDKNTIICVGGGRVQENFNRPTDTFIDLISCGECDSISKKTVINQPNLVNGAYWYFTPGFSFGFATDSRISQIQFRFDVVNMTKDDRRLSWIIDGPNGGGRLGQQKLENTKKFYKYILSNAK